MAASEIIKSIIETQSDDFAEKAEEWRRAERLFKARKDVADELTPFTWEVSGPNPDREGYDRRKSRAIYLPLGKMRADAFVGTIMQKAPQPGGGLSFGALGEVRDNPAGEPTSAELLWENASGTGHDAQAWDAFWDGALRRASATDFRWILAEAPPERPTTRADEIRGLRPYLVEFSPADVPYAVFGRGQLMACRVEIEERRRGIEDGKYVDKPMTLHYLMTARGWTGFGTEAETGYAFEQGGWWIFNEDGELVDERFGDWSKTGGEIPMCRLYYERTMTGEGGDAWTVNSYALQYMDLFSWMWNDAYVSGGRKRYWLGVTPAIWELLKEHTADGAVDLPVPGDEGASVSIYDTGDTTASEGLLRVLDRIIHDAMRFIIRELTTSPDASGVAKILEVLEGKSPRLAHIAGNIEEAQTIALRYLEQRWTGTSTPESAVTWPRTFDLRTVVEKVIEMFGLLREAGAHSPTLGASLVNTAVKSSGFVTEGSDLDMETVYSEILGSLETQAQSSQVPSAFDVLRRRRRMEEDVIPEPEAGR